MRILQKPTFPTTAPFDSNAAAYDQAIADYSHAIALDPKYALAYSNRCWIGVVVARQLQRALSDCDEALRIEPQNNVKALDNRGFAYLKLERVDDAIKSFDAALKIDPKFPSSLYGRGLAKMKNGDRESAAVDMATAKAIKSNVAEVLARYSFKLSGPILAGNNGGAIVNSMIDSDNYSGTRN